MSLRLRLIVSVALVLGLGMGLGGLLAGWHAARTVGVEMRASLRVGQQAVQAALGGPDAGPLDASLLDERLRELVAAFDGNRHVRAVLVDGAGRPVTSSRLAQPEGAAPGWLRRLPGTGFAPLSLALPAGRPGAVVLQPDPVNELGEAWGWLRVGLLASAAFLGLACLLIHWIVGRALAPLDAVSGAFRRIGSGDYAVRIARRGSPGWSSGPPPMKPPAMRRNQPGSPPSSNPLRSYRASSPPAALPAAVTMPSPWARAWLSACAPALRW